MAYFANGSEGMVLDDQCCHCRVSDEHPCPIQRVQLNYNYEQCHKGNELLREAMNELIDANGNCQMKPVIDDHLVDKKQTKFGFHIQCKADEG